MSSRSTRLASLCLCFALFPMPNLGGTTVVAFSADEMISKSRRIIHGTCKDRHSYRDARNRIVTRYTFWVAETLKGDHDSIVQFVQPGGEVQGVTTMIPGLSQHRIGDEVVIFLGDTSTVSELCLPVGLDQGLYRVKAHPVDGTPWVDRTLRGLRTVRPPQATAPNPFPNRAKLEDFKRAVRDKVRELRLKG